MRSTVRQQGGTRAQLSTARRHFLGIAHHLELCTGQYANETRATWAGVTDDTLAAETNMQVESVSLNTRMTVLEL